MLLDVSQCVQLDAIHANNAGDMQLHGDTRAACDGDGVMNGVRCHVTRRFVKTMTWMIPGGGYSEIFGHICCRILLYAKSGGIVKESCRCSTALEDVAVKLCVGNRRRG